MTIREKQVQDAIMLHVGSKPFLRIWRQNVGKARAFDNPNRVISFGPPKGAADLSGALACGRRIEIECKRPGGKQSPDQRNFEAVMVSLGVLYVVVDSVESMADTLAKHLRACSICAARTDWATI